MIPAEPPLDRTAQTLAHERAGLRVMMALDRGSRPVEAAQFLAGFLPPSSRVRIVTVVPYQEQPDSPWSRLPDPADAAAQVAASSSRECHSACQILQAAGASVSVCQRYGREDEELLCEATDWCADLIVLEHHSNTARWFLGSTTEAIVKRSRLPVLVVPSQSAAVVQQPEDRFTEAVGRDRYSLRARLAT